VCSGVESRLREVEDTGEADDEAINFSESGETEDFGGVVAVGDVSKRFESNEWTTYETAV